MGLPITLLWVDEHVVVADKPSGLLVHRGWDDDDDVAMFRVRDAIGEHVHAKYAELKTMQAERCPKILGSMVKTAEIQYHHEVTNQLLWSMF